MRNPTVSSVLLAVMATACMSDENFEEDVRESNVAHREWHREADVTNAEAYREVLAELRDLERGTFTSDRDEGDWQIDIAYAIARPKTAVDRGSIIILNGRSETYEQYGELIYDLRRQGYTLYLLDHRGQGRSDRMINFDRVGDSHYQKGTVDDFGEYSVDVRKFLMTVVQPDRAGRSTPLYGLGHSMGATVLTLFASLHPDVFDKLALSSPMFALDVDRSLGFKVMLALHPHDYANGGPWSPGNFANNALTGSRGRFTAKQEVFAEKRELRVGGPTFDWVDSALDAMVRVRERNGEIKPPVLLFSGGSDRVVETSGHRTVCRQINTAGGSCRLIRIPEARHEPLIETDEIRSRVLDTLVDFFEH